MQGLTSRCPVRSDAAYAAEQALIGRARAGDKSAFEELYRRTNRRVYGLVLRVVGNTQETDDVTQEAYFQVYRALPKFEGRAAFLTWVYRIAMNVSLQHVRARTRRIRRFAAECRPESAVSAPRAGCDPERELERRALYAGLSASIGRLNPTQRAVTVLGSIQGRSYVQMGRILGASPGIIKGRLHRARESLRAMLTDLGLLPAVTEACRSASGRRGRAPRAAAS